MTTELVLRLDDDTYRMLTEISTAKGRTPEDSLQELLVAPVHNAYFFEITAPDEYFRTPSPLSPDEAPAVRDIVQPLFATSSGAAHRPEAVIAGLISAAYEQAVALCQSKGWRNPNQHADYLLTEMVAAEGRARELHS